MLIAQQFTNLRLVFFLSMIKEKWLGLIAVTTKYKAFPFTCCFIFVVKKTLAYGIVIYFDVDREKILYFWKIKLHRTEVKVQCKISKSKHLKGDINPKKKCERPKEIDEICRSPSPYLLFKC